MEDNKTRPKIGAAIEIGDRVKVSTYSRDYIGTLSNLDPIVIDNTIVIPWTRHIRIERA